MKQQKIQINPCQTVLVLGGYGFLGRHLVAHLEKLGAQVIIGTRGQRSPREPGTRTVILHKMIAAKD